MDSSIMKLYVFIFARRAFVTANLLLVRLGMHGLGILNYKSTKASGESRFLRSYLKQKSDCVVIDVGANIGDYTQEVIANNKDARVYAFEPHPVSFKRLTSRFRHSSNIHTYNGAVGMEAGQLTLYDRDTGNGTPHASIFRAVIEDIHHAKTIGHKVSCTTLDSFVEKTGIEQVDLLKIDTEGSEFSVLQGAVHTIRAGRINAIHFEFNEMNVISRVFFRDFWNFLPNYVFYRMLPTELVRIDRYSPLICEVFAYQNIVAIQRKAVQ